MNAELSRAGIDLDRIVAEKVMGWSFDTGIDHPVYGRGGFPIWGGFAPGVQGISIVPDYSTDLADAMLIADYLTRDDRPGQKLYFKMTYRWDKEYGCWAYFDRKGTGEIHPLCQGHADTIPLAICRAALKAVENAL